MTSTEHRDFKGHNGLVQVEELELHRAAGYKIGCNLEEAEKVSAFRSRTEQEEPAACVFCASYLYARKERKKERKKERDAGEVL